MGVPQRSAYISPVGFSSSIVPQKWRLLYSLNPMVGVIDGFRWAILGGKSQLYWSGFILSVALVILLFIVVFDISASWNVGLLMLFSQELSECLKL